MNNDGQARDTLREIFDAIATIEQNQSQFDFGVEEHAAQEQAFASLDALLSGLSNSMGSEPTESSNDDIFSKLNDHLNQLNLQTPEDDTFPSHPMEEDIGANLKTRVQAIGDYSKTMLVLTQLRAKGINIPSSEALSEAFSSFGNDDPVSRANAAEAFRQSVEQSIKPPLEKLQKVLSYVDRIEKSNGNSAILQGIMKEIRTDNREELIQSAHIAPNVISFHGYPHQQLVKSL